ARAGVAQTVGPLGLDHTVTLVSRSQLRQTASRFVYLFVCPRKWASDQGRPGLASFNRSRLLAAFFNGVVDDIRHHLGQSERALVGPQYAAAFGRGVMARPAGDDPHVGEDAAAGDRPEHAAGQSE